MRIVFILSFFLISTSSHSVTLDIEKFKVKASHQFEKILGDQPPLEGSLIFRDGVGSTDVEPMIDYASFIYMVEPESGVFAMKKLKIGYQVTLSGEERAVLLMEGHDQSLVILPGTNGFSMLAPKSPKEEVSKLISRLNRIAPGGIFQHLPIAQALTYKAPPSKAVEVMRELFGSEYVLSVELRHESYRAPFMFAPPVVIKNNGKIDPDQYRTVSKVFKEDNREFTTETSIPSELQ